MQRVQQADVYVSSIGTALQYVPFLRNGCVYLAVGSLWRHRGRVFPTFMEQQLAGGGTPYLRTLYMDPAQNLNSPRARALRGDYSWLVGINPRTLERQLTLALQLVRGGFPVPVPPEQNLSPEGRVLLTLCRENATACRVMTYDRIHCDGMIWPSFVVYEVAGWGERGACRVDRGRLRQLRKEHGLPLLTLTKASDG